ncbi:MAG TPA: thioesterase family protein [Melioribacteraceae bacterium]|nr:thioesterase family protein [Melioribacteraceae bacterium]
MFEYNSRVNFYNCDPAGLIFFGEVFKFAHSAYELFLEHLLPETNYFTHPEIILPIIKANAQYLNPLKQGDEIKITVSVTRLQEKSFELTYNIYNKENNLCVIVETVHVCLSKSTLKKIPLDDNLREKLMLKN